MPWCWFHHKIANVLSALLKSTHPDAKKALADILNAEDKEHAPVAVSAFSDAFGVKWSKAAARITDHVQPFNILAHRSC